MVRDLILSLYVRSRHEWSSGESDGLTELCCRSDHQWKGADWSSVVENLCLPPALICIVWVHMYIHAWPFIVVILFWRIEKICKEIIFLMVLMCSCCTLAVALCLETRPKMCPKETGRRWLCLTRTSRSALSALLLWLSLRQVEIYIVFSCLGGALCMWQCRHLLSGGQWQGNCVLWRSQQERRGWGSRYSEFRLNICQSDRV